MDAVTPDTKADTTATTCGMAPGHVGRKSEYESREKIDTTGTTSGRTPGYTTTVDTTA